jgi:hypothetical protein
MVVGVLLNPNVEDFQARLAGMQDAARIVGQQIHIVYASTEGELDTAFADLSVLDPPIIPYGGFSPVRLEGWPFRRGLPNTSANLSLLPACAGRCLVCVHPSRASSPQQWHRSESGLWARLRTAIRWSLHHPRGPRSGPGYSVPVRHHLIGPIRPTRGHIAISPHGGLYAMPSLCGSAGATRERFRAFAAHSLLACRPLRPRGVRSSTVPEQRCRHGLRRE